MLESRRGFGFLFLNAFRFLCGLALGVFYFFFRSRGFKSSLLTAIFLGFGYYTYFASRGVPLMTSEFAKSSMPWSFQSKR